MVKRKTGLTKKDLVELKALQNLDKKGLVSQKGKRRISALKLKNIPYSAR